MYQIGIKDEKDTKCVAAAHSSTSLQNGDAQIQGGPGVKDIH